jgi:hypothetical protein
MACNSSNMLVFRTHILRDQRRSLANDSIPMDRLEGALEHLGLFGVALAELAINATSLGQNVTASTLVHTASNSDLVASTSASERSAARRLERTLRSKQLLKQRPLLGPPTASSLTGQQGPSTCSLRISSMRASRPTKRANKWQ